MPKRQSIKKCLVGIAAWRFLDQGGLEENEFKAFGKLKNSLFSNESFLKRVIQNRQIYSLKYNLVASDI